MSADSLDIYIKSLILEAARLDSREIHIKQGEGRPEIAFQWQGEKIDFPHPPKKSPEQLVPRLREIAGLDKKSSRAEEHAKASIDRRGEPIDLDMTFKNSPGVTNVTVQIVSDVAVSHE